ncbi:MAG: OmpH family outer membrane protein [Muribaculaceae bacterium]|nr:OmpH family outer membrane protein [Muribaculaceae bacterium]MDE6315051.1 OmpH family outer membrane protein [Muribaculaceae bacterium]MDE6462903.1 OmpH family outer membrane protein [Muribaculaceae bacterium]MDE6510079.1 OmpH family outer membrane protein [Muribaculaceae bacterium]
MLKKIIITLALIIPAFGFAQKIGTVDVDAIFKAMPELAVAEQQFNEFSNAYKAELSRLNEQMDKEYAEFQALADSNPIKASRQRSLEDLQMKIQQFYETANRDMENERQRLMQPIHDRIDAAIKSVGTRNGFSVILPQASVSFVGPDVADCTSLVKAELKIAD